MSISLTILFIRLLAWHVRLKQYYPMPVLEPQIISELRSSSSSCLSPRAKIKSSTSSPTKKHGRQFREELENLHRRHESGSSKTSQPHQIPHSTNLNPTNHNSSHSNSATPTKPEKDRHHKHKDKFYLAKTKNEEADDIKNVRPTKRNRNSSVSLFN